MNIKIPRLKTPITLSIVMVIIIAIALLQTRILSYEVSITNNNLSFKLPAYLSLQELDDGSYEILQRGQVVGAVRYITAPDTDTEDFKQLSQYMKAFYGQENGSFWSFQGGDNRMYDVDYAVGKTRADFCYSKVCVLPDNGLLLFDLYSDLFGIELFRRSILDSVTVADIPKT